MKSSLIIAGSLSIVILVLSATVLYRSDDHAAFLEQRAGLVMRQIGHSILLHAGDSSSRLMPIQRIDATTFQIDFQSQFSFMPDSLVEIVHANLEAYSLGKDYMVNVFDCQSQQVVYGFAMGPEYKDIVPCQGRAQPEACYAIQIAFADFEVAEEPDKHYLLYMIGLSSMMVFALMGKVLIRKPMKDTSDSDPGAIRVGTYLFDMQHKSLKKSDSIIQLSDKETKILKIFALQPNQLVTRDRLLKEVWEDEGVFTGRSLDVFISKLRKKLQADASVRLTNVHAQGYILEVAG